MEGDRLRLQWCLDAGAHRRPEAGDLRLSWRRHRHLPARRRDRGGEADPRSELAQRRRVGRSTAGGAGWGTAGRSPHRRPRCRRAPPRQQIVRGAAQRPVPVAGGVAGALRPRRHQDHPDRPTARPHRFRPRRRYRSVADHRDRHVQQPAGGGQRHRGHRGEPVGRPRLPGRTDRRRHPRGLHRRLRRLLLRRLR